MSSTPTPASSRRRTASTIVPARWRTPTVTLPSSLCGGSSEIAARARAAACASEPTVSRTSRRSPPTRSFSSSGVPSAMTRPWSITAIRSASRSASSRYCVVSSTVRPSPTSSSIVVHTSRRLRGSRPVVGSSRKRTGGLATSAAPRSSLRRMPPE
jgi:hypothetical protein